ncbi:MAG: tryptophanyl-tRNA synthetase [Candidatus Accumulibacter sp. SK-11]|nr:MAG: tryptophanyl-tRNA synthetase [Candidatus Accumulibacter sp. SK-11]
MIDGILREQAPMRERAQPYLDNPRLINDIIADGNGRARHLARETMRDVRQALGLDYG